MNGVQITDLLSGAWQLAESNGSGQVKLVVSPLTSPGQGYVQFLENDVLRHSQDVDLRSDSALRGALAIAEVTLSDEAVAVFLRRTHAHTPADKPANLPTNPTDIPNLAREQDILAKFVEAAQLAGVVGEEPTVATEYLAITSRLLDKPVSLLVKGASSSGKSFATEKVCQFFPSKATKPFTGMSEKALLLSKSRYDHRTIVIYEATALRERAERQSGDQTAYYIRSLVSEGRTHYEMSVRGKDGSWSTQRFEKQGPTNVIITTTSVALHNENETRMLSLTTNDTPSQTRNVLLGLATEAASGVDYKPWHELQDWLFQRDNQVVIPFAKYLAENIPPVAVRLRRDFGAVLSLIKAHTVLHQATRDRDETGRIIATPVDYEAVRSLVLDVVSQGIGATVSPTMRETVATLETLPGGGSSGKGVSASELGRKLKLDPSAARRRLLAAATFGYVVNNEERPRRAGRYVVGEPMPEDLVVLPALPTDQPYPWEIAGQGEVGTLAPDSEEVEVAKSEGAGKSPASPEEKRAGTP